jgi:hypothetical protein
MVFIFIILHRAEDLDYVLYRVGLLAVLRSKSRRGELFNNVLIIHIVLVL